MTGIEPCNLHIDLQRFTSFHLRLHLLMNCEITDLASVSSGLSWSVLALTLASVLLPPCLPWAVMVKAFEVLGVDGKTQGRSVPWRSMLRDLCRQHYYQNGK